MNRKTLAKAARWVNRHVSSRELRYRPRLDALEERTVLSRVSFHIVQSQSSLALSGTLAGVDIQQQDALSLSTTYFGDFQTDIDEDKGVISFIGTGNDFCSADSGNWAPRADGSDGTAPAAYGAQDDTGTILAAIRDFHWQVDTGGSPLHLYQNNDGSFGFSSTQNIQIHQGYAAYSHPDLGYGSTSLGGLNGPNQAGDGNLVDNGDGTFLITIPVSFSVSGTMGGVDYTLNFEGTGVGTGAFAGLTPAGHARKEPTIALVSGAHSIGIASLVVPGSNELASARPRGINAAGAEIPLRVQDVRPGHAMAPLVHHATAVALESLTVLDSVFQELAEELA
jgi:hypothetical protein